MKAFDDTRTVSSKANFGASDEPINCHRVTRPGVSCTISAQMCSPVTHHVVELLDSVKLSSKSFLLSRFSKTGGILIFSVDQITDYLNLRSSAKFLKRPNMNFRLGRNEQAKFFHSDFCLPKGNYFKGSIFVRPDLVLLFPFYFWYAKKFRILNQSHSIFSIIIEDVFCNFSNFIPN